MDTDFRPRPKGLRAKVSPRLLPPANRSTRITSAPNSASSKTSQRNRAERGQLKDTDSSKRA
jgi:hypothetical protein